MDMRTKVVLQDCAGVEDHVQEGRKESDMSCIISEKREGKCYVSCEARVHRGFKVELQGEDKGEPFEQISMPLLHDIRI